MASHFTSAQLALFRSALSTLAGGIAEGDKDNADVKVLSEVQQTQIVERELVEDNLIQPVIIPAKESSKPESKKLFPGFSWFSKKDKSVVAPRADKSILDEAQVAAKTTFVEPEVVAVANPKTVSRVASDSHLVISFFAGLPWSKKNAAAGSAPAFSATKHGFESKIDVDYQPDSRIAGSFFTDLPWSSKAKIAVAPVAISADRDYSEETKAASLAVQSVSSYFPGLPWSVKSVKAGVATQPVALDVKTDNLPVLSRNTVSVNSFFASLPWSNDSRKSADSVVAPGLAAKQESVTQSPKIITIDRKSAAQRISSPTSEADRLVKDYFAALPWTLKAAKSVQKLDSTLSIQSNVTNLVSNASVVDVISGQTASSFFSNAAWAQPKAGSVNTQGVKFDLKQSISESQSEKFATAVDSYFQALPWQVKPASNGTEAFSITGTGNSGSTGMFAVATQSALRASQKGKMNNSQPENKRIDTFFSSLPWSGNG